MIPLGEVVIGWVRQQEYDRDYRPNIYKITLSGIKKSLEKGTHQPTMENTYKFFLFLDDYSLTLDQFEAMELPPGQRNAMDDLHSVVEWNRMKQALQGTYAGDGQSFLVGNFWIRLESAKAHREWMETL